MDDSAKIEILSDYLRQTYAKNIPGLRKKIDEIANNGALEFVTIHGDSFEGSSHQGQITLEPLAYLGAALAILHELDPDNVTTPPPSGTIIDFSRRVIGT